MTPIVRLAGTLLISGCLAWPCAGQEEDKAEPAQPPARLGILLDTSPDMGFLVPQLRKELRLLNEQLRQRDRPEVVLSEFDGASLDVEGSTAVPGRRNALYALKELYEKSDVDTVYWITALRGSQSGDGFFAVQQVVDQVVKERPPRRLFIRNIWQDQLQAGDDWVRFPPTPEVDPLNLYNRPQEWYQMLSEGRGMILRSWQTPPEGLRYQFGFPHRVRNSIYLQRLGISGGEGFFDTAWAREFAEIHGLHCMRPEEDWLHRITGRRWLFEGCLTPFIDEETLEQRSETVYAALCERESIEEDLQRIPAKKIGVLFGFGYDERDLQRFKNSRDKGSPYRFWKTAWVADLERIGGEIHQHREVQQGRVSAENSAERVYVSDFIALKKPNDLPDGPDPFAARMARLVREEKVDAIYFFTNGYVGGGNYGTMAIDLQLVAHAIKEAGVKLYLRLPFEFGPTPIDLQQLALASGGGIFLGKADDEDWNMAIPSTAWPIADEVEDDE